jgi:hypothetical protein
MCTDMRHTWSILCACVACSECCVCTCKERDMQKAYFGTVCGAGIRAQLKACVVYLCSMSRTCCMCQVGQNRIYALFVVLFGDFPAKNAYIHRISYIYGFGQPYTCVMYV